MLVFPLACHLFVYESFRTVTLGLPCFVLVSRADKDKNPSLNSPDLSWKMKHEFQSESRAAHAEIQATCGKTEKSLETFLYFEQSLMMLVYSRFTKNRTVLKLLLLNYEHRFRDISHNYWLCYWSNHLTTEKIILWRKNCLIWFSYKFRIYLPK